MKKAAAHPARSIGFLSRLFDGELEERERAEFDDHRRQCAECARAAAEYEAVLELYRRSETGEADPNLAARISRQIDARLARPKPTRFLSVEVDVVWASAVAICLVAVLLVYGVVAEHRREELRLAANSLPSRPAAPVAAAAPSGSPRPVGQIADNTLRAQPQAQRLAKTEPPAVEPKKETQEAAAGAVESNEPASRVASGEIAERSNAIAAPAPEPMAAMAKPGSIAQQDRAGAESAKIEEPVRIGPEMTAPILIRSVQPIVPFNAASPRLRTGSVVAEIVVTKTGEVDQARIVKSIYAGYDAAVLDAVRQWKYKPATKDGQPVAVYLEVKFTFKLN